QKDDRGDSFVPEEMLDLD
ncbi:hypothetical protein ACS0PU_001926, partial [Formica fusca]